MSPVGRRFGGSSTYAFAIPANATFPGETRMFVDYVLDAFREGRPGWPTPMKQEPGAAMAYHAKH